LFNPVNWKPKDPVELHLPAGYAIEGVDCQVLPDGGVVAAGMNLPSMGLAAKRLAWAGLVPPAKTELPKTIETAYYTARIDPETGALVSLKLKDGSREMRGGPANVVLAEEPAGPHNVPEKAKRKLLASSSQYRPSITVARGKVATVVEVRGPFHGGGELRREMRFYERSPRIDFVTETNRTPAGTILSVEFPLAEPVTEMRRGIPYGFSRGDCVTSRPEVEGVTKGIMPVIRWSDYRLEGGGGVAILDRGVPGRELVGSKAIILLHSVCDVYIKRPVIWMADEGKQTYGYALVAHAQGWDQADIARMAWEYNSPVSATVGRSISEPRSFVDSSDNVIVEAMRRDGDQIELRLMECTGKAGPAWVRVNLPHDGAALTDLLGGNQTALPAGPVYEFAIRPQQIVTVRLQAERSVAKVEALRSFETGIPPAKRRYMQEARNPALIGHPPREP